MQQSAKRLTILVNNDELAAIDDFRFENRLRNRSDAGRALRSGAGPLGRQYPIHRVSLLPVHGVPVGAPCHGNSPYGPIPVR